MLRRSITSGGKGQPSRACGATFTISEQLPLIVRSVSAALHQDSASAAARLRIAVVHAGRAAPRDVLHQLRGFGRLEPVRLSAFMSARGAGAPLAVLDMADCADADVDTVAAWRGSAAGAAATVIFIADEAMRHQLLHRGLNRAANVVKRPLAEAGLADMVRHLAAHALRSEAAGRPVLKHIAMAPAHREALQASDDLLDGIFAGAADPGQIDLERIVGGADVIVDSLGEGGIADWVAAVRMHHNRTYQHCLLVTGTLLAFGHHFRLGQADLRRLAVGGLLHDLGKADIPISILDKPAALDEEELAIMRTHPEAGIRRLANVPGATAEVATYIRDHHELLDGSGYPNGLSAASISDPVRLLTIADIFSALIERRSYKPEMPTEKAIAILDGMKGKIDPDIFKSVIPVLREVKL